MIQRKQTLFLLELIFLGVALLFVPSNVVVTPSASINIYLLPPGGNFTSTLWHYLAIGINFICLLLAIVSVFLYKTRLVQVRLCYLMMGLWTILTLITAFFPFTKITGDILKIQNNYFGVFIGLFAILATFLAARFINKDIELLKSADRIR